MLFIVHAIDKPGALPVRLANYDAHKAFLATCGEFGVKMVMSGPLVADDGQTMVGSFLLLEAADGPQSSASTAPTPSIRPASGTASPSRPSCAASARPAQA